MNYILESSLSLGVLILLYRLLLKKLNNLLLNRVYIASSMLFAAALPFVHLKIMVNSMPNMLPDMAVGAQGSTMLEAITIYAERTNQAVVGVLKDIPLMQYLYITGIALLFARLIFGLYKLHLFKKQAELEKFPGYLLVNANTDLEPFSFFSLLFINRSKYEDEEYDAIVHHELAHIQLKHSFDNLLLEFILIIQWFNPFAWMLRRDLKEIHEYQADRHTISTGVDPKFYKELLLGKAMGTRVALGNNLNHLLIKKRLEMINNRINKSPGFIRMLAVAAVFGLLVVVFACERDDQKVYTEVDQMPEYPGGIPALRAYLAENLNYPEAALKNGTNGKVYVSFVVTKEGNVADAQVVRSIDPILDEEALRVINQIPEWDPGIKDGKKVNVQFTMPIVFNLPESSSEEAFVVVEDMPKFEGGIEAVQQYIRENILYPENAQKRGIEGKVFVSFVVAKTGKVKDVKIVRSIDPELDAEAVRVVSSIPDWKSPGMQHGEAVDVNYTMPIDFVLTDKGGAMVIEESIVDKEKMLANINLDKSTGNLVAKGIITDANNNPLKGAHVIIEGTNSGATTNAEGKFELTLDNSDQDLVISYIGKETIKWSK